MTIDPEDLVVPFKTAQSDRRDKGPTVTFKEFTDVVRILNGQECSYFTGDENKKWFEKILDKAVDALTL